MTGLPQGVTLEPVALDRENGCVPLPGAVEVHHNGRALGVVWPDQGAWHAGYALDLPEDPQDYVGHYGIQSRDAAVRWVCLQARPVVYQVRQIRSTDNDFVGWDVFSPDSLSQAPYTPTELGRQLALTVAHSLARQDVSS